MNFKNSNYLRLYQVGLGTACGVIDAPRHARCVHAANGHQDGARSDSAKTVDPASSALNLADRDQEHRIEEQDRQRFIDSSRTGGKEVSTQTTDES